VLNGYRLRTLIFVSIFSLSLLIAVCGCSSLQNYTKHSAPARASIAAGNFNGALATFPETAAGEKDEVLIRLERGMILQDLGEFEQSSTQFEQAAGRIREIEDRAVISAGKTASEVGTLVFNEQVMPYEGEDFEIILLHALNAVNYLMRGDLEGARVEVRKSYERQEQLSAKHGKELQKAQADGHFSDWERSFEKADSQGYVQLKEKASTVVSLYQNAFASYISAIVYELYGENDDAYIDLKKAYQAYPSCRSIQRDLVRLSMKIGFREDQELWEKQFGMPKAYPKDAIDVFVIFSYGLAPYKIPLNLPIPISRGFTFASLPVYKFSPSDISGGLVTADGLNEETSTVFDVDAVAARDLLDDYPIIFVKQIARSYLKTKATSQLAHNYGDAGAILGIFTSAITEQADLRAWLSLPKQIQVARLFVPRSSADISIRNLPGGYSSTVQIPQGASHVIVYCRATPNGLAIYTKSF
jgi:hypothetical protein